MNTPQDTPGENASGSGGDDLASHRPTGGAAVGALRETGQAIRQDLGQAATDFKQAAGQTVTNVRQRASQVAGDQKEHAAACADRYGNAIRESARSFEEQDPNIASLANKAADKIQEAANYIRGRDWRDLRADAEDFGRRHPLAFFGGLFVAGLILGNALKATAQPRRQHRDRDGYEPEESSDPGAPGDYISGMGVDPRQTGALPGTGGFAGAAG